MRCWLFDCLHDTFRLIEEDDDLLLVSNDGIECAKCLLGTALSASPSRLSLFFAPSLPRVTATTTTTNGVKLKDVGATYPVSPAEEVSEALDDATDLVKHITSTTLPPSLRDALFHSSSVDAVIFERGKLFCELPHFCQDLLIVVLPARPCANEDCVCHEMVPRFWPRWSALSRSNRETGPFLLNRTLQQERALNLRALSLRETPEALGDIGEALAIFRCVVEFSAPELVAITPEYVFPRLPLCEVVPFSMCRSLIAERPCPVRVWVGGVEDEDDVGNLKREWPFRTLRCQRSQRPTGLLFRVQVAGSDEYAALEWFPSGFFRVSLEECHYALEVGVLPDDLETALTELARGVLDSFLRVMSPAKVVMGMPNQCNDNFTTRLVDVQLNYTAFAAVTDIKRLVDDEVRQSFFVETRSSTTTIPGTGGGRKPRDKSVSLVYSPASIRVHSPVGPLSVRCKIIRSASNGVLCRIRLRGVSAAEGIRVMQVMAAAAMIRYSVVRSLPREFEEARSTMSLQHVDPELHFSVKNSGLSRKIWKFTDSATGCERPRRPVPINLQSEKDMARYERAKESQWLMWYRGVWYGAVDDENDNGAVIRELRAKTKGKRGKTPAAYPKELRFFNAVVLKEITEQKYRTPGYEGEEYRYFPACIRYRGEGTLPDRCLAIMGPLYRRGLVKFRGRGAEDIVEQLEAFNRRPTTSASYVIKANKTLSAGDMGELPEGAVYDWSRQAAPPQSRLLRRGVHRDRDRRYAALHALLTACKLKEYVRLAPVEAEPFVRKYWKEELVALAKSHAALLDEVPRKMWEGSPEDTGVTQFNDGVCEMFSLVAQHNVVVLHYSYTTPQEVGVTFAGKRYRPELPTLVLLKTLNGSHYEAIVSPDNEPIPETEIARLFEAFYPAQHQHDLRVRLLLERSKTGDGEIVQIVRGNRQIGLWFPGWPVPIPVVNGPVDLRWRRMERDLVYGVPDEARTLILNLFGVSVLEEELLAYKPKRALADPFGQVHAVVLNDSRLICRLAQPVLPEFFSGTTIEIVENLSLRSPFMGIPGTVPLPESERWLALSASDEVRQCFKRLLFNIRGWVSSSTVFDKINALRSTAKRREHIRLELVVPAINSAHSIPISRDVMCAMLTSYIDHHPDHNTWLKHIDRVIGRSGGSGGSGEVDEARADLNLIQSFPDPQEYLKWLVRRRG